ncbi:hypothetical protein [Pseudacidovorax sp. NFM-22]|uniref:hypothetical protein n=1 Tax=Pseudacidovorax sp. NFM-22 TaxID=2744469 RepID=UPI001F188EEE|nr:hypothetical protein [Pseudacidovorax sp. NFM-22]
MSNVDTLPIIGLQKPTKCMRTGAAATWHEVHLYQVNVVAGSTVATLGSYASREDRDNGLNHLSHVSAQIPGTPTGDAVQWIYAQLLASSSEKNVLAGATAVRVQALPAPEAD